MDPMNISLNDIVSHFALIGLDIYPPIEMKDERTRLNMFFEDARLRWSDLYVDSAAGESEFKISKSFRENPAVQGPAIPVDTFVMTHRGPVFVFPIHLPDPGGQTDFESRFRDLFNEVSSSLWSFLPGHKVLKVGLVREVTFLTGNNDCTRIISQQSDWLGSKLAGGKRLIQYRDQKCNIRLEFSPVRIGKVTQLPIGTKVQEPVGFGLQVKLDVNNAEVRELKDADIEEVLDRAIGFWPDELLEYLSKVK